MQEPFSQQVRRCLQDVISHSQCPPPGFQLKDSSVRVRQAEEQDSAALMRIIRGLADFEKKPDAVILTEELIRRDGFGREPLFYALLVEKKDAQCEAIGAAFVCFMYSTWEGRTLYLEDLFVSEGYRHLGIGSYLFYLLAQLCQRLEIVRFEWKVLDWNTQALNFYTKKLGAYFLDSAWRTVRLGKVGIHRLAGALSEGTDDSR